MKVSEIPFEMGVLVNDELIETAQDIDQMKEGISYLVDELAKVEDDSKKGQMASMAGVYSRIVEDFEASEKLLNEAIGYFLSGEKHLMAIYATSRLATTQYCYGKYSPSDENYKKCIAEIDSHKHTPGSEKIHIYCLDHWARSKYMQKLYQQAIDLFTQAHEEELVHGNMEHMTELSSYMGKMKTLLEEEEVKKVASDKEKAEMEENYKNHKD